MKKKKAFSKKTALLLTAAAVLLAGSGIGSARAALTYYSANYTAQVEMSQIGVTLNENGDKVSWRDYESTDWNEGSNNGEDVAVGSLLTNLTDFAPGNSYKEEISVTNSGNIDSYVRVIITKSWQKPVETTDSEGNTTTTYEKDPSMNLKWIDLAFDTSNGWVINEEQSTDERTVLYYTKVLEPQEENADNATTPALSKTIRINEAIAADVTQVTNTDGSISYEYEYNGYKFTLDAEVDAVQTHNAEEAIKSAWGVDVSVGSDGTITLE